MTDQSGENLRNETLSHHDGLLKCQSPGEFISVGRGIDDCILCEKYYLSYRSNNDLKCRRYPAYKRGGKPLCKNTPWRDMATAVIRYIAMDNKSLDIVHNKIEIMRN